MPPARLAVCLGGATLLVAWLANAAAVPRRAQIVSPPPAHPEAAALDALASDVQSQAVRLRERLAQAPAPVAPARNPFAFRAREVAPRPAPPRAMHTSAAVAPPAESTAPDLLLTLDGVAEQHTASGIVRTAIVAGPAGEVFMVTEGQTIAGRYAVIAVTPDVLELKDLATGATRRLVLQTKF